MLTARTRSTAALMAAGCLVLFGLSPSGTSASNPRANRSTRSEAPAKTVANPQDREVLESAKSGTGTAGADAVGAAEFVGMDTCIDCHGPLAKTFKKTSHGRVNDPRTPAAKQACETCHGPGGAHVEAEEGQEKSLIGRFGRDGNLSRRQQNNLCMQCHRRGRQMWEGSAHAGKGVTCQDCHSVHQGNPKNLKFASLTKVCLQCHQRIQSDLTRVSHHPVREGKVICVDCHNPHGSIGDKNLKTATVNETCWKCHAEKRGPFLFEHGPAAEDCTTCHVPHGSNHPKLLIARQPWLCQRCHVVSQHPGTLVAPDPTLPETVEQFGARLASGRRTCTTCHVMIHGSNNASGKRLTR